MYSDPAFPMITFPFTMRGAPVMVYDFPSSAVCDAPHRLAGLWRPARSGGIHGSEVHLPIPDRDAAVGYVAAGLESRRAGNRRIVHPELFAGCRVECLDLAPRRRHVHDTVDDDRGRFLGAMGGIEIPCQASLSLLTFWQ